MVLGTELIAAAHALLMGVVAAIVVRHVGVEAEAASRRPAVGEGTAGADPVVVTRALARETA